MKAGNVMAESAESTSPSISSEDMKIVSIKEEDTKSNMSDMHPPAPKRMRPKKFCDLWLSDPLFTPWLAKCEGSIYEAKCLICNKTLQAGRNDLRRHSCTKTHREHMAAAGMQAGGTTSDDDDSSSDAALIKKAELRYVLHIVHHSRSFSSYEHYVPMVQAAHPDCNCISLTKMQFKRSKIAALIKNVLNRTIVERTITILRKKLFSILIDENTDIAGVKCLCILVRYVHEGNIRTYLLDYVKVKDANAESLYKYLKYSFEKYHLSMKNIIGISSDNASVMGKKKSVVTLLLKENPTVAVFPYVCHSMHLLASDACKCLPENLEKFLHRLYTHLSRSPKRQGQLQKIQVGMHLAKHKMIQPSKISWLALSECVCRVLEQWDALIKFFDIEVTGNTETESESDSTAQSQSESGLLDASDVVQSLKKSSSEILPALRCLYTRAYFEFVNFALDIITKFNRIFQTSGLLVHNLLRYCNKFLKEIGSNFLNYTIIEEAPNLHEVDPFESDNLLPLETMYIGSKAKSTLEEIKKQGTNDHEQEKITKFLQNCQKFYQTAYKGALKRLPFKDNFVKSLEFLDPAVALDITKHTDQIDIIINKFGTKFDLTLCNNEWRVLAFFTVREKGMQERLLGLEVIQFWQEVGKMHESDGKLLFPNITNLALACLSLSHSNTEIERFFSLVNEIKTPERNRLQFQMVAALGRIKLDFRNTATECYNYDVSDDFLKHFNKNMYKKEHVPEEFKNTIVEEDTRRNR